VVVDHDSGALVWAAPGRNEATLQRFLDALGVERAAQITRVSPDAADWIANVVAVGDNRVDMVVNEGAKSSPWWATKDEWLGLITLQATSSSAPVRRR
jgi:hypothetical protein